MADKKTASDTPDTPDAATQPNIAPVGVGVEQKSDNPYLTPLIVDVAPTAATPDHPGDYNPADDARGPEYPALRTARFDEPIIQSLGTGTGQHQPMDPAKFDPAGRPRQNEEGTATV